MDVIRRIPIEVRVFAILGVLAGVLMLVLVPPLQVPDEDVHFERAYQVSVGNLFTDASHGQAGGVLPSVLRDFASAAIGPNAFDPSQKYDYATQTQALSQLSINNSPLEWMRYENISRYSPVLYAPQAVGIAVARLFTDRILPMFVAARVANLLVYLAAMVLATWLLPRGRWPMAVVGLMPMAMFVAASVSSDALTLAGVAVFTALLFRVRGLPAFRVGWWIALAISAALLGVLKPGYAVLGLGALILVRRPAAAVPGARATGIVLPLGIVAIAGVSAGGWLVAAAATPSDIAGLASSAGVDVDVQRQTDFTLAHPLGALHALMTTWLASPGNDIITSFFGDFGWLTAPVPIWVSIVGVLVLIAALGQDAPVALRRRAPELAVGAISVAAFLLALSGILWLNWTRIAGVAVAGIQGRYLLPVAAFAGPFLAGIWRSPARWPVVVGGSVLLLVVSAFVIFYRYV